LSVIAIETLLFCETHFSAPTWRQVISAGYAHCMVEWSKAER